MRKIYINPQMNVVNIKVGRVLFALSDPQTPDIEAREDDEENEWY